MSNYNHNYLLLVDMRLKKISPCNEDYPTNSLKNNEEQDVIKSSTVQQRESEREREKIILK